MTSLIWVSDAENTGDMNMINKIKCIIAMRRCEDCRRCEGVKENKHPVQINGGYHDNFTTL
jgi:hypothetical protein